MSLKDKVFDLITVEYVKHPKWLISIGAGASGLVYGYYFSNHFAYAPIIGGIILLSSIPVTMYYYDKDLEKKEQEWLNLIFNEPYQPSKDKTLIDDWITVLKHYS